jgi:hypothetical protein
VGSNPAARRFFEGMIPAVADFSETFMRPAMGADQANH